MPEKQPTWEQIQRERDERVDMPLDPDEALRGLLKVDPESEPVPTPSKPQKGSTNPAS